MSHVQDHIINIYDYDALVSQAQANGQVDVCTSFADSHVTDDQCGSGPIKRHRGDSGGHGLSERLNPHLEDLCRHMKTLSSVYCTLIIPAINAVSS